MVNPILTKVDGNNITSTFICPFCEDSTEVTIPIKEHNDYYLNGLLAQNAMRNQPSNKREVYISGMCFSCQENTFGE